MKKLRVGILFGGCSSEHEVSLLSTASVLHAIDNKSMKLCPSASPIWHRQLGSARRTTARNLALRLKRPQGSTASSSSSRGSTARNEKPAKSNARCCSMRKRAKNLENVQGQKESSSDQRCSPIIGWEPCRKPASEGYKEKIKCNERQSR